MLGTGGFSAAAAEGGERNGNDGDGTRQMESLDRGLVAVPTGDGVLLRWRLFGTEPADLGFHVYRDGDRVNNEPITDSTNYLDPDGTTDSTYAVRAVGNGRAGGERRDSDRKPGMSKSVEVWDDQYKEIPLDKPDPVEGEDGETVTYHANDASAADLTGDGTLDIVQKWTPSNAKDNSQSGQTSDVLIDGYTMDGERLWRINLGQNVRAGAHYTPFLVYDFDGDGKAELVVRTADGTEDAAGNVIGDPDADWTNPSGYVLEGPEYLTVFDGETGEELATEDFQPARGDACDWGDCYGNRVDRFLAGTAYIDGERPSIVFTRGYYEKTMLAAWDFRQGELDVRWIFDSEDGNEEYEGVGAHTLGTADVDGDGKDEIVFGGAVIDHDGTGLHATTMSNPDAQHCGDFLPDREGLEIFVPAEYPAEGAPSLSMRDAETGEYIWAVRNGADIGRAMIADVDPNYAGAEAWAGVPLESESDIAGTFTADGEPISETGINSVNSGIWWTGDLHRELLDHEFQGWDAGYGVGWIKKWNPETEELDLLQSFEGTRSNNSSKGNPCLSGDFLGDWREEVIWRTDDSEALRLYATPHETDHRLYTLLHDPQYRTGIARQNVGYNQPPWPSFFLGHGMDAPPEPDIKTSFEPAGHDRLAEISASETDATLCDDIEFDAEDLTGNGRKIRSLSWELGDGTTATGSSVTHTYEELGVYPVKLTATGKNGETTTDFETITIDELDPIARAVPSATRVDMGESVDFEAEDISGDENSVDSLTWEFGDGTTATGWSATHSYDVPGEYTVTLNATAESGCTASYTVTVTVDVAAGTYRLTARHTADDKVVEVVDGSAEDGTNVQQGVWEGADSQRWEVTELDDEVYRIENVNSGLVMEADGGASEGGNVVQGTWEDADRQKWEIVPVGDGYSSLRPLDGAGDFAADVFGVSTEDGATLGIWTVSNGDNQQFAFLDPSA
ncbi:PKD domain containing protein [Halorubrum lipolyticum DSM 21995]|uniref:PKD domain containing protein n=2 Tax=Halorubrum lipolyticum TaxID=368624 RepID=M0NQ01_9EURY|nr:PKD domain containing protein [Halorubrum lipolyticum DSM 21995]